MVLDCPGCHHSYDVSSYKSGQRLRCRCGQILVVPGRGPEVRAARTLHCNNCGGHLKKGQPNCPFCGALVDLTHARLTAYCPSCLSMSKEGAKFCSGCGKPLTAHVDTPQEAEEQFIALAARNPDSAVEQLANRRLDTLRHARSLVFDEPATDADTSKDDGDKDADKTDTDAPEPGGG